jgi:hypothetical protein
MNCLNPWLTTGSLGTEYVRAGRWVDSTIWGDQGQERNKPCAPTQKNFDTCCGGVRFLQGFLRKTRLTCCRKPHRRSGRDRLLRAPHPRLNKKRQTFARMSARKSACRTRLYRALAKTPEKSQELVGRRIPTCSGERGGSPSGDPPTLYICTPTEPL